MKKLNTCSRTLAVLVGVVAFALASPAWAGVGSGALTVDNNGCGGNDVCPVQVHPSKYDVTPGSPIHIHIQATAGTCVAPSPAGLIGRACTGTADCSLVTTCNTGTHLCKTPLNERACSSDADCVVAGTCQPGSLECAGDTTVWIKGKHGSCQASQVGSQGDCDTGEECVAEGDVYTCAFNIPYPAFSTGSTIDVCATTPSDGCFTATVAYCNVGTLAADNEPNGTGNNASASGIRYVNTCAVAGSCSENGNPCIAGNIDCGTCDGFVPPDVIEDCERVTPPCSNEVGSYCCGLTQGAYGAPNGAANSPCSSGTPSNCPSTPATAGSGCGFIAAACSQGCNVFAGDPDATTAGIHNTRSVTIDNQTTLISYLPIGSTAGCFKTTGPAAVGADTHYDSPSDIPDLNPSKTASRGEGGGVLAGQAMATRLNDYLSNCSTFGGSSTFTATGFGGFQIPSSGALVCTRTSGGDKALLTGDDVCRAFQYPACTWGQTIGNVLDAANNYLATCTVSSATLGCSADELNVALTNANEEFDNCGVVISCGAQTTAGTFTCP